MLHGGWFQKFPRIILLENFLDTHTHTHKITLWNDWSNFSLSLFLSFANFVIFTVCCVIIIVFYRPRTPDAIFNWKKIFFLVIKAIDVSRSSSCRERGIGIFFLFSLNCQLYIWFTFGGYWMMGAYFQFIIDLQIHFLHIDDNRWWPMCFFLDVEVVFFPYGG